MKNLQLSYEDAINLKSFIPTLSKYDEEQIEQNVKNIDGVLFISEGFTLHKRQQKIKTYFGGREIISKLEVIIDEYELEALETEETETEEEN